MSEMSELKKVKVLYKYADGAHFFISDDEATLGLCVAHKDPVKAFGAVSIQLTKLFKENYGQDVVFVPSMTIHSFLKWFSERNDEAMAGPTPGTAGIFPWEEQPQGVAA